MKVLRKQRRDARTSKPKPLALLLCIYLYLSVFSNPYHASRRYCCLENPFPFSQASPYLSYSLRFSSLLSRLASHFYSFLLEPISSAALRSIHDWITATATFYLYLSVLLISSGATSRKLFRGIGYLRSNRRISNRGGGGGGVLHERISRCLRETVPVNRRHH